MRKKTSLPKKALKFGFYGAAAVVGVVLAASYARKKGGVIKKKSKKLLKKTKNKLKSIKDGLTPRQKKIIDLFDREDQITNEMIQSVITGVTERTIRRDLNDLEEMGYIKKLGKTKGSYYVLV